MPEEPQKQKLDFGLEVKDTPPTTLSQQEEEEEEEEFRAKTRLEGRLKRKLDYIILPCLAMAYFLCSMVS